MVSNRHLPRALRATSVIVCLLWMPISFSQAFDSELLDRARSISNMVPGDHPLEVRFQDFVQWSEALSLYVEDAAPDEVPFVCGVFQIRFADGWIMVDAGADREYWVGDPSAFSEEKYAIVGEALSRANMIVLTHEHGDHAASLFRGIWADEAGKRALLTVEQKDSFLAASPDDPITRITPDEADRILVASYEELLAIAPGVVLVKAPGHTPGSQIVFVTLASGEEILLIGDVVWHESQIQSGSQKGQYSYDLNEDREALRLQIQWLQEVIKTNTHVIAAHDLVALEAKFADGVLTKGLDLSQRD